MARSTEVKDISGTYFVFACTSCSIQSITELVKGGWMSSSSSESSSSSSSSSESNSNESSSSP